MPRTGKQINSPYLLKLIPLVRKTAAITGGGGGIAGDHYNTLGRHLHNAVQGESVAALSRRVGDYNIGSSALVAQELCRLSRIGADEVGVLYAVLTGVELGVFHRLRDYLRSCYVLCFSCHGKPYGSCAAVKVKHVLIACQRRKLRSYAVKLFRLSGVHLIK